MELDEFRRSLDEWLDARAVELAPAYRGAGSLDQQVDQINKVKRLAYDDGWMQWGWPERVGGQGGSTLLRGYLGEALTARELVESGIYSLTDLLAPTMIDYARPDLAATMVPRLLRGEETWCQGFSEPGTGSNLASLTCRAVRSEGGWRVTGQKVWTSLAQYAHRCVLLTRTGSLESAHRGITVRPIGSMHGVDEFCEVFFDDVAVPEDRTLGEEGHGWSVAMDILPYERSTALWHRGRYLHERLQQLVHAAPPGAIDPAVLGEVTQAVYTFRARSRATQYRLAAGERLGPETSIDKVLLATAEQALFDLAADAIPAAITVSDDPGDVRWRRDYLYSRAATIYGGSAEIQRNIIARRLLDLGDDR